MSENCELTCSKYVLSLTRLRTSALSFVLLPGPRVSKNLPCKIHNNTKVSMASLALLPHRGPTWCLKQIFSVSLNFRFDDLRVLPLHYISSLGCFDFGEFYIE